MRKSLEEHAAKMRLENANHKGGKSMRKSKARQVLENAVKDATTPELRADLAVRLAKVVHLEGMERARRRRAKAAMQWAERNPACTRPYAYASMYVVEKGVPRNPTIKQLYPFDDMEVGDSFFVEVSRDGGELLTRRRQLNYAIAFKSPKEFEIDEVEGGLRCWRTK